MFHTQTTPGNPGTPQNPEGAPPGSDIAQHLARAARQAGLGPGEGMAQPERAAASEGKGGSESESEGEGDSGSEAGSGSSSGCSYASGYSQDVSAEEWREVEVGPHVRRRREQRAERQGREGWGPAPELSPQQLAAAIAEFLQATPTYTEAIHGNREHAGRFWRLPARLHAAFSSAAWCLPRPCSQARTTLRPAAALFLPCRRLVANALDPQ